MGKQKEFVGIVTSDKMQKTIIVKVRHLRRHTMYNRTVRYYSKFKVHDEKRQAKIGDEVLIRETRPLSKDKRFRLVEVVKKTTLPEIELKEA
jgi:small subunit ribosomal protein S17